MRCWLWGELSLEQTTFNKTMRVSLKGTVSSEQSAAKQTRAYHFEHTPDGCLRLGIFCNLKLTHNLGCAASHR